MPHNDAVSSSVPAPGVPLADHASGAPLRIALVAGEASGDLLGAGLIEQLRARYPQAVFAGVGGDAMRGAGMDTWHDASELAVMGLSEVLRHLPRLLKLRKAVRTRLLDWRPDVFIGIDAPDFNLGLERTLKDHGIRTVHYVSPSIWAWRQGRAAKIGRSADLVLCLFPMEPPIYATHGVDARFVGHPLAEMLALEPDRALPHEAPVLAVLPGSRLGEIGRLGEVFLDAAACVADALPGLRIVLPAANAGCRAAIDALLAQPRFAALDVQVLDGDARTAMVASDVVLLASGTATLEALLAKRPMVVGYRIAPSTAFIVRLFKLMRVDRFSLPNVLAGRTIAPEFMQEDCTAENLSAAVLHWFRDPQAAEAMQPVYRDLHLQLRQGASATAADAVARLAVPALPAPPAEPSA